MRWEDNQGTQGPGAGYTGYLRPVTEGIHSACVCAFAFVYLCVLEGSLHISVFLWCAFILISQRGEYREAVGALYVCVSVECFRPCWSVSLSVFICICVLYICVCLCLLGSPALPGCWPDLAAVSLLPAAATNVAYCLPIAHKSSPDIFSFIYCCNSLSSGRRAEALISSQADTDSEEWMSCQMGRHPSPWGPNLSCLRFFIWQGNSSPEVIPELSSPVLNCSIKWASQSQIMMFSHYIKLTVAFKNGFITFSLVIGIILWLMQQYNTGYIVN